jgi:hypothetical protein
MTRLSSTHKFELDSEFHGINLIDVAPHPAFSGLCRPDEGMSAGPKMLGRMLVLRGIAATHVSAT